MNIAFERKSVTLDDFGTGMIAGLASEKQKTLSVRNLDSKIVAAFDWFQSQDEVKDLNLRFRITLNKYYRDSPDARNAIRGAVARGLLISDNDHTLYLDIAEEEATAYFSRLPGSEALWRGVARTILETI